MSAVSTRAARPTALTDLNIQIRRLERKLDKRIRKVELRQARVERTRAKLERLRHQAAASPNGT